MTEKSSGHGGPIKWRRRKMTLSKGMERGKERLNQAFEKSLKTPQLSAEEKEREKGL